MTDLRENLGWIVGSAIAGIAAFLSWFYESGLLSALVGIFIGAGIAYFVQTRTQKRVWKREYALKTADTVYGPLFEDIDKVLNNCGDTFQYVYPYKWSEVKNTYQYLTVDEAFRNRLDKFFQRLQNYNDNFQKSIDLMNRIVIEETLLAFPSHEESRPEFRIKPQNRSESYIDIIESLRMKKHPENLAERGRQENEKRQYFIGLIPNKGGAIKVLAYDDEVKKAFDIMWNSCSVRVEQDSLIQNLRKEYLEIVKELQSIKKELIRRIQEPWKI